ncbi:hypothetical protein Tco_0830546 [Tanacetum coccineum]
MWNEILKKFGFSTLRIVSTPMETSKLLLKDAEAEDVDVYLYRSRIGSLMYLTASRPDIIIFRHLKGHPKLGLWYPKDSPFDLEAYTDNDYAGASPDKKFITGCCQFLRRRLVSWQCKKQTIIANSITEAEYVAAANCCGQFSKCSLFTTPQMVIKSPCLTGKKELAIPGQTATGKELSNLLMAGSLPKTIIPIQLV